MSGAGSAGVRPGYRLVDRRFAAALLWSEQPVEYSVVGDTVNLSQRLQQLAAPGQVVLLKPAWELLSQFPPDAEHLASELVKRRDTPVAPWRIGPVA
jgi:class 3 adenylate cyclase